MSQWIAFFRWSHRIVEIASVHLSNTVAAVEGGLAWSVPRTMYSWSKLSVSVEDRPVSKGPLLSVTAARKRWDRDGTLPSQGAGVPGRRDQYSWFQRLVCSRASLKAAPLYSMAVVSHSYPLADVTQTHISIVCTSSWKMRSKLNLSLLRSEPLIQTQAGLFYLRSSRAPIMAATWRRLQGLWYVGKVIWAAFMFLYNLHWQAKNRKATLLQHKKKEENSFQLSFITNANIPHLYAYNSLFTEQNKPLTHSGLKEKKISRWFKKKSKSLGVPFQIFSCSKCCTEEYKLKNYNNWKPAQTVRLMLPHDGMLSLQPEWNKINACLNRILFPSKICS